MSDLKDGDLYAGRPIRLLTDPEADAAASTLGVDRGAADALYGKNIPGNRLVKGSQEAKEKMAELRAKRGKRAERGKKDAKRAVTGKKKPRDRSSPTKPTENDDVQDGEQDD